MAVLKHRGATLYLFTGFSEKSKCQSIRGGAWNSTYKCWTYPFASLGTILENFPGTEVPDTVEKYRVLKEAQNIELKRTQITGGEWEHSFLMKHQKMGVEIARKNPRFGFFYDTGTGKTIMMLGVNEDRPMVTLVICPLAIIRPAWIEDCQSFFPDMKIVSLHPGNSRSKSKIEAAFNSHADVYIINFESFKILYDMIRQLPIKRLIIDESSKMKDHSSQITKDILSYGRTVQERYILSGTPAPNSELEYFSQIELIAPGLLGSSFYSYRNRFFQKAEGNEYKYVIIPEKKQELSELLATVSVYVSKDDCLDLPPYTFTPIEVQMTAEQKKIYKQMEREQYAMINDDTVVLTPNKLTSIMKLRQITSGFIFDEEKVIHSISESKTKALKEELLLIGNKQAVIWIQFREEVNMIRAMIAKEFGPSEVRTLFGGTNKLEKDIESFEDETTKDAVVREFKAGKFRFLICHPRTAMYGLTFTNAHYAFYYSMSHSYEEFHQSRDRIVRYSQKENVTIKYLVCNGTIDKAIFKAVQCKKEGSEEILHYIRVKKGGAEYDETD